MKKWLIPFVFVFSGFVNAQQIDAQTGNIVYTTLNPPPPGAPYSWDGFVNYNTGGGGLSGGYTPAYNTNTGTFIFGYNQGTVNYSTAVNFALANAGVNIQVNGFKYRWEYYNQDYSRGTLTGNISLTDSGGNVLQSYNYNMPQTTNGWTWMSGKQLFNTQYASTSLGNLQVSFTGKDDRYWAGYYGPQIRNIDVKLLYTVPSSSFSNWSTLVNENGNFTLSSPGMVRYGANGTYIYQNYQPGTYSCSNWAWGQDPLGGVYKSCEFGTVSSTTTPTTPTIPTSSTTTSDPTTTTVNNIIASTTIVEPEVTTTTTSTITNTGNIVDSTSTTALSSTTSSPTSTTSPTTTSSSSSSSSTSTTTATATPTVTATATSSPSGGRTVDGTGIGLSVVSRNQQREQAIAMQAAQSAVAQADQASQQAQQDAVNVASSSSTNSVMSVSGSSNRQVNSSQQRQDSALSVSSTATQQLSLFLQPNALQQSVVKQTDSNKVLSAVNVVENVGNQMTGVTTSTQSNFDNSQIYSLLPPQQVQTTNQPITTVASIQSIQSVFSISPQPINITQQEQTNNDSQKMLLDRSNPIFQTLETKNEIQETKTTLQGSQVNRNVANNELAGGVDITRIAQAPTGYNEYLNLTLRDAAFYAPKEVYKNQKNVDNMRALRQLSSDRLHQQMIEQQYGK